MMQLGFSLLSISGHYADVGLVGDRIDIPLFPRVSSEQTFHGSFWGNYTDLSEVMALAAQDKIRHTLKMFTFGVSQASIVENLSPAPAVPHRSAEIKFAIDSSLEGDGFEPMVPRHGEAALCSPGERSHLAEDAPTGGS
jgi:hypothetical protein